MILSAFQYVCTVGMEQLSLWEELYQYFRDRYFTMDFGTFENFTLSSGKLITLSSVIFGILIGIMIASVISVFQHNHLGDFVRSLLIDECTSPEKAETLEELGYGKSPSIRSSLRHGRTLRSVIRTVEGDAFQKIQDEKREVFRNEKGTSNGFPEATYRVDLEHDHFYIPEATKYAVDVKFEKQNHGCLAILLTVVGITLLAVVVTAMLPDMLHMLDNFISMIQS